MGHFPEDCDTTGTECMRCVQRTAESMRALTADPTPDWAAAAFRRMYSHAACRMMEHTFVQACGGGGALVSISAAA